MSWMVFSLYRDRNRKTACIGERSGSVKIYILALEDFDGAEQPRGSQSYS